LRSRNVGTPQDIALLQSVADTAPRILYPEQGCRDAVMTPVFDFPREARKAIFEIRRDYSLERVRESLATGNLQWLIRVSKLDVESPEVAAAMQGITELNAKNRNDAVALLLSKQGDLGRTVSELIVQALLAEKRVPTSEVFARLDGAAALRLLRSADEFHGALRGQLLIVGQSHPETASFARIAAGRPAGMRLAEYLNSCGEDAVPVLAGDRRVENVRELGVVFADEKEPLATRLNAATALHFIATPEAREELLAGIAAGGFDDITRGKIEGWLAR
jgi:hypothetical protein